MRKVKFRKSGSVTTFEYTGTNNTEPVTMQLFVYNDQGYLEHKNIQLQKITTEIQEKLQADQVAWLNIHGLHDTKLIQQIGSLLHLEDFLISDILNIQRRTRMEELDDMLFFSVKSVLEEDPDDSLQVEQISFLVKGNLLISFQEKKSDYFTAIRERIRTHSGSVRRKPNDYLLCLLLDAIMDNFFITVENYEGKIEKLLAESKLNNKPIFLERIEKHRENLNFVRRSIVPLRDSLYSLKNMKLEQEASGKGSTAIFFARLHQKTLELLEQIEYDNNALESASSIFFSSQNQKMNQIMKTLTMFSGIFMPLTFIAGIYGMNFRNMPELEIHNGYYYALGSMVVIAIAMIIYFRKKNWF